MGRGGPPLERELRLKQPTFWQEWGNAVGWITGIVTSIVLITLAWARTVTKVNLYREVQLNVIGRVELLEAEAIAHRESVAADLAQSNAMVARELAESNAQLAKALGENNAKIAKALADANSQVGERLSALETTAKFQSETMTAHGRTLERIESLTVLIQKEGCWRAAEFHKKV